MNSPNPHFGSCRKRTGRIGIQKRLISVKRRIVLTAAIVLLGVFEGLGLGLLWIFTRTC